MNTNYKLIALKRHKTAGVKLAANPITAGLASYLKEHAGRILPGALGGAGVGGLGGFLFADGGRNMLTGQQYSPTIGQRVSSGLQGALGGAVVGGAGNLAVPGAQRYLRELATETTENAANQTAKQTANQATENAANQTVNQAAKPTKGGKTPKSPKRNKKNRGNKKNRNNVNANNNAPTSTIIPSSGTTVMPTNSPGVQVDMSSTRVPGPAEVDLGNVGKRVDQAAAKTTDFLNNKVVPNVQRVGNFIQKHPYATGVGLLGGMGTSLLGAHLLSNNNNARTTAKPVTPQNNMGLAGAMFGNNNILDRPRPMPPYTSNR